MKFTRTINNVDPKLVLQAEDKLSKIFLELGTKYENIHVGSGLGGDPLIFGLMYPIEHVCTLNMPTAATDGKRFYWNPNFVNNLSRIGLRLVCSHEAWHALYMHPQRVGSRLPKLWNIAVDYIVNGICMEDIKARKMDPGEIFSKNLGRYMTLSQFVEFLKDPSKPPKGFEDLDIFGETNKPTKEVELPHPNNDRALTPEEQAEIERREAKKGFFYADPNLEEDMKRPEKIYDLLYKLLPKCPKCGKIGYYQKPKKDQSQDQDQGKGKKGKKGKKQGQGDQKSDQQGDQGQGNQPGQGNCPCDGCSGCPSCGDGGVDIFGIGGTLDDHIPTSESEEKLAQRISDAVEAAKKMAGVVPASLEDELGLLTAPKVTWQDIVRTRLLKARSGNGRNDWTRFRTRPMFCGMLVPKRRNYFATFGCLLDTSGSMSTEDMAFGLSQLQSLDERSEGTIVPVDCEVYWDKATKVKTCKAEELSKVKVVGRGGTVFSNFFKDYKEKIGECDFLIVVTDGYLFDADLAEMKDPQVDVIWLVTSGTSFKPPFGRAFDLRA